LKGVTRGGTEAKRAMKNKKGGGRGALRQGSCEDKKVRNKENSRKGKIFKKQTKPGEGGAIWRAKEKAAGKSFAPGKTRKKGLFWG